MSFTTFPIPTSNLSDALEAELPVAGVRTTNVATLATSGSGTYDDPYLGWDAPMAALLSSVGANQKFFFPSGTYEWDTTFNWGAHSNVQFHGEGGTVLKYTGTGIAVHMLAEAATSVTYPDGVSTMGIIFENFIIDGTETGTTGLKIESVHGSKFRNIGIRSVTDVGLHLAFSIYNLFDTILVTPNVGQADGIGQSSLSPEYGLFTETGTVVDAGPIQTNQDCTFINFVAEECTVWGAYLGAFLQNTFIGGSCEFNGNNVAVFGAGNTWIGVDNEYPTGGYDWHIVGDYNQLINCLCTHNVVIGEPITGAAPVGTIIEGGQFGGIHIHPLAVRTKIRSPQYNFTSFNGFYDGSASTEYFGAPRDYADTEDDGWSLTINQAARAKSDIIFPLTTAGPVLTSPNGSRYRLLVDNAGALSTTAATAPSIDAVSDDFNDNSLGKQWHTPPVFAVASPSTAVTVAEAGSELRITLPNTTSGTLTNGVISTAREMADTGFERIKWTNRPTSGSYIMTFGLYQSYQNNLTIVYTKSTNFLDFNQAVSGAGSNIASIAFNPATMIYWRFLRSGANIKAQYSADGSSWTDLGTSSGVPWGTADDPYVVLLAASSVASSTYDNPVAYDDYLRSRGSY